MEWAEAFAGVGALLAIGAALDFAVKRSAKKSFLSLLARVGAPGAGYEYNGTIFLDQVFGRGLFSLRAIIRYCLISFTSMCVSYSFAHLTTPSSPQSSLEIFPNGWTALTFSIVFTCVLLAIAGDIASYSITRLFIRTVDSYKSPIVSLGLVVADIISSLCLFFLAFSFARLIAYVLVLNFVSPINLTSNTEYLPDFIVEQFKKNDIPITSSNAAGSATDLAEQIASAKITADFSRLALAQRKIEMGGMSQDKRFSFVRYSAFFKCVNKGSDALEITKVINDTSLLIGNVAAEQNQVRVNKISQDTIDSDAKEYLSNILISGKSCPYKMVVVRRRIPVNDLVAIAGPANTYLASAERTLYDAYTVIGFKLSPYVEFNPYKSMPEFVQSLDYMMKSTFLGIATPDEVRSDLIERFSPQIEGVDGGVNVPFSPMAASSLTSSVFFICYLIAIAVATLRSRIVALSARVAPNVDLEKAVFTTVALTASGAFVAILVICDAASSLWEWAFL